MQTLKEIVLAIIGLFRSIAKYIALVIIAIILVVTGMWIYHSFFNAKPEINYAAKVENVKTMVRHNALQIVDETIYTDTIDGICEVYSVKARVTVNYDLEKMRYHISGDTLIVELPRELIDAKELDRRLLDEYYADGQMHFTSPTITGKQSKEIEYRMKQFVKTKMVNQEHIKRARQNELRNMVRLLHTIHGNVKVVMNINHPEQEISIDNVPMPLDR